MNSNNAGSSRRTASNSPESGGALRAAATLHVLEDDKVARNLYSYLLRMQKQLRAKYHRLADSASAKGPAGVPIPDTVVYEHNFPQTWFTYDTEHGEIVRLSGKYLDAQRILEGFSSVLPGCGGICAQFCAIVDEPTGSKFSSASSSSAGGGGCCGSGSGGGGNASTHNNTTGAGASGGGGSSKAFDSQQKSATEIIYLTPDELQVFLYEKDGKSKEGILQKFVAPRGENNDAMVLHWSVSVASLTRRANIHRLDSRQVAPREKACTFDGMPNLSIETRGNEHTVRRVSALVKTISQHLLEPEHKVVSRFVGVFKQDRDGMLWFLYATSIRVENSEVIGSSVLREPVELSAVYEQPPSAVSDAAIADAMKLHVSMNKPASPVHRGGTSSAVERPLSALLRSPTNKPLQPHAAALATLEKINSMPEKELPPELQTLIRFIDDTLYALYASIVVHKGRSRVPVVVVKIPTSVQSFLGREETNQLMMGAFGLLPVAKARLKALNEMAFTTVGSSVARKPQSVIRNECDEFIARVKEAY